MKKRIISLLLALCMILASTTFLFACKDKDEDKKTDKDLSATEKQLEEGTIFYDRAQVSDNLPEKDYGGREFRIVSHQPWEFEVEEEERGKGNLITDAIFSRNEAVEKRYNVTLKCAYTGTYQECLDYVSKTVLSGADEFDLLMGMAAATGAQLVTKKVLMNWYDIPYIDFSQPWWASDNATELTVNGKCPIAVSDLNFTSITQTYCMLFNKDLAASYELGDIYSMVLSGEWTFDKLQSLVKDIYNDENGNNKHDEDDLYGFNHTQGSAVAAYLWAFDNPVCTKNAEGVPEISIKTDKINNIVSEMYDFLYNTTGVYYNPEYMNEKGISMDRFLGNKSIFVTASLSAPTNSKLRDFESDYGLIPYPKWDENQTSYYTMADGYHTVLAVPKTCSDTEFVGIMVEALSAETWKLVTPTLYEIALKNRYLRDDESKEVLDLIINGRRFDFGYVYDGWQGFSFTLQTLMGEGKSNFESYYNSRYKSARTHYKAIVKQIGKM